VLPGFARGGRGGDLHPHRRGAQRSAGHQAHELDRRREPRDGDPRAASR
jgi:hypothetical protein